MKTKVLVDISFGLYDKKTVLVQLWLLLFFEGAMTKSQTGLITAVFYLVYAPLQVVGGIFADKYDPEKLIKIGLMEVDLQI